VQINALLDEGANRTSMSTAAARMIGLEGTPMTFRATGFGGSFTEDNDAMESEVYISDLQGSIRHRTAIVCITNPLGDLTPDNWNLLPARTPHVNGVTERMIQSMKSSLKHVISDGLLTDDELLTAAKKTQGILNSRPLAYQGTSDEEPKPLTPAHFLADKALQDIQVPTSQLDHQSRYRLVQQTMNDAWKRFQKDVISKLNTVTKWIKNQPNLEVGDVVVVMDAEESGKFPLGVITEVLPGPDGLRSHRQGPLARSRDETARQQVDASPARARKHSVANAALHRLSRT
jgi:hypothetical protein